MKLETASSYPIIKKGTYALEPRERKKKKNESSFSPETNLHWTAHPHTHAYTKFSSYSHFRLAKGEQRIRNCFERGTVYYRRE